MPHRVDMSQTPIIDSLSATFDGLTSSEFRGQTRIVVARDRLHDLLRTLRDQHGFDMLIDITCVDYLNYRGATERFGMVYLLARSDNMQRLTIRVFLSEPDLNVPTVTDLWSGADWMEREVWDMFGITFDDHPDLRRILLPEEFTAHPLRKDYPLQGRGERHNFPVLTREEG